MNIKTIKPSCGSCIDEVCREAVATAKAENCIVEFDFNGIKVAASPDSEPELLAKSFSEECTRRQEEYLASPEYKSALEAAEQKEQQRKAKVEAFLADAPATMTLANPENWEKSRAANTDPYGGAVLSYAERWARIMESRMAKGERIADMADESSHLANEEGITGFMYGAAVATLAHCWKHGEALRMWHNLKTQIRDEGEKANESGSVLNPALLTIG